MPVETVTLKVAGQEYTGWTSVSIRRSIETLASSFDVSIVDFKGAVPDIIPGDPVEVYAGKDRLVSGYVDEVNPEVTGEDHSISIAGRSKVADLVDCSAGNKPGKWAGAVKLSRIIKDLVEPFGVGLSIVAEQAEATEKDFTLTLGESPLDAIKRLCAGKAILPIDTTAGNLHITNTGSLRSVDALVYRKNVMQASAKISDVERFYKYLVRAEAGSEGAGWQAGPVAMVEGSALDGDIRRQSRIKIFKDDDGATAKIVKTRAAWEAQTRRGKGVELTVQIFGWRQSDGTLWRENLVVPIDIPPVRISGVDMLVSEVLYTQNKSGTILKMTLNRADTYAPEPKKNAKSAVNTLGRTPTEPATPVAPS